MQDQRICVGMAGATLVVAVTPAVYEQLKDRECLKTLGAEHVFVASQPSAVSMLAYQQAQQLVQP